MSFPQIFHRFSSDFLRDKHKAEIFVEWQPEQASYLVAGSSLEKRILMYDRLNKSAKDILLPGPCSHLAWSRHGLFLCIACTKGHGTVILMWSPSNQKLSSQNVDTGAGDIGKVTWIGWCRTADILAIAYSTGSIVLLDKTTDKFVVIRGHHSGVIIDGAWSNEGVLATSSLSEPTSGDGGVCRIAFVTQDGDKSLVARECPYGTVDRLQFATSKFVQSATRSENTLCCVANRRTLVLFNLEDESRSLQYSFKADYGDIVEYSWFGDGYVLLCFQKGVMIWVSSHPDEQGKEMQHVSVGQNKVVDMAAVSDGSRSAVCTHGLIKVFQSDLSKMRHTEAQVPDGTHLLKVAWSSDGVLLAAIGGNGQGFIFLTQIPSVGCSWRNKMAYMVSLDSFEVSDASSAESARNRIKCNTEPTIVALGPNNFAAAVNNFVAYYQEPLENDSIEKPEMMNYELVGKYEYPGIIMALQLTWNKVVILMTDGRVLTHQLHPDPEMFAAHVEETLTTIGGLEDICCIALSEKNLYFGTLDGDLGFLGLPEYKHEIAVHHTSGITSVFVKEQDAIVVFIDSAGEAFLYNIINDICLKLPDFAGKAQGVLFDWSNQVTDYVSTFIVHDAVRIQCCIFMQVSVNGSFVEDVGKSSKAAITLDRKELLLGLYNGDITILANGSVQRRRLGVFPSLENAVDGKTDFKRDDIERLICLHRYHEAAAMCRKADFPDLLLTIAERCVRELDLQLAISAYRHCARQEKVLLLERYRGVEHIPKLAGYMALTDNQAELACDWLTKANDQIAVLNIHCDLMQWDKAMALAQVHAPEKISYICQQQAKQLELLTDYNGAAIGYKRALAAGGEAETERACKVGLARVSFRIGDLSRGFALCRELGDAALMQDCAALLEEGRHFKDAGRLYSECGNHEKAAGMYLKAKEWKLAEEIVSRTESIPLKLQLATAKEAMGDFKGAIELYEAAGECDGMVRLLLEAMNRTDLAIEIVDRTRSQEGAKMVAAHFMKLKDFPSAIRYLLISNRGEEAFLTAQQYQQMDVFTTVVGENQPAGLYEKIGAYYEEKRDIAKAAHFLIQANKPQKAVTLIRKALKLSPGNAEQDILLEHLVTATVNVNDSVVTDRTIQFLLGSEDGLPKDEKFLLDLYLMSGQLQDADRITLLVADHHLKNGDYREAHQVLYRTHDKLLRISHRPSAKLLDIFTVVHSHAVSTIMYSIKEHDIVARMLSRICRYLNIFPKDASRFLLSAVLECSRCKMDKSAMEFALLLMQPEHRIIVTQKYESKILNILRRGDRTTEADDMLTECPFGSHKIPRSLLICPLCKIRIPFCILTGMHIIRSNFTLCPKCEMPANYSDVMLYISRGVAACPMCASPWTTTDFRQFGLEEVEKYLQKMESLRYIGEDGSL